MSDTFADQVISSGDRGGNEAAREPADAMTQPQQLPERDGGLPAEVESLVACFEGLWLRGERPALEDFLPPTGPVRRVALIELVHAELECRLKAGEPARVEDYLDRYPELAGDAEVILGLIQAEFEQRRRRERGLDPGEYLRRFPAYEGPLRLWPSLEGRPQQDPPLPATLPTGSPGPALGPMTRSPDTGRSATPSTAVPVTRLSEWIRPPGSETTEQVPAVPPGRRVGCYEVIEELGRGGMGVVYKAVDLRLKRVVALKMIRSGSQAGREQLERFRLEAQAVARLQHPHIVQIYEVGEDRGCPFFALEFVAGSNLDRQIAGTPQPARAAALLVEKLARAMYAAHQRGIVHRDLKPANVLLARKTDTGPDDPPTRSGAESLDGFAPKVTDFGLAKRLDEDSGHTRSGAIMGTPSYMAPEQALGRVRAIGPATDIYALGAILYELLTGRPPFKGQSVWDTLAQVQNQEPVAPRQLQPGVARDLETVCLKCLHKEARRRYGSALELAEDLRRFLVGEPISARPAGPVERGVKWARRRPTAAALVGVLVLVAVGVTAFIPWDIARLKGEVARSNTRVLELTNRERRAGVLADCRQLLGSGKEALAHKGPRDLRDAQALFTAARDKISADDAQADPALRQLQDEASRLLDGLAERERAAGRLRDFFGHQQEAFFQLNRDLFTGTDPSSPRASRQEARAALALFGLDADSPKTPDLSLYEPADRTRLTTGFYEVLLILAEAEGKGLAGRPAPEQQRQARAALALLDRADRLVPSTQVVHRRRATYLALLGDAQGAARERALADAGSPVTPLDWFLAGYDRGFRGDLQGAVADFDEALRRQPDLFWAQLFRSLAYRKLGNLNEARAGLTLCIRDRPDFVWAYLLRGFLHGQLGDFPAAEADFAQAERLNPDQSARYVVQVNRGYLAVRQGQLARAGLRRGAGPVTGCAALGGVQAYFARAVVELRRAIALQPDRYHGHVNLAQAHKELGQPREALQELAEAIRLQPGLSSLYRTRARLLLELRDRAGALRDLDEAIALEPAGVRAPVLAEDQKERGLILLRAGRPREALEAAEEALKARANYPEAQRLQAEALLALKRYREAVAAFDRYLEHGRPEADVFHKRAVAEAELGDYAASADEYTRALAVEPSSRVRVARGWVYLSSAAPRLALHDFEEAVRLEPDNGEAYNGRGFARAKLGQYREAVSDAEEALRRGRKSPRLLYNAARTYAEAARALLPVPGARDPRARSDLALEMRSVYRARAVRLLCDALALLPPAERGPFWRDQVQQDSALAPIARDPGFARLAGDVGRKTR